MRRCCFAVVLVFAWAVLSQSAQGQPRDPADEGNLVPPAPAPTEKTEQPPTPGQPPAERAAPSADSPRDQAAAAAGQAQRLIGTGRYEDAVRAASRAIALDPQGAAAYKKVRAQAYAALGRYEEALADQTPLQSFVASDRAQLKSGYDVVAGLPGGTPLELTEVRGNWLKVASAGEQEFEWAWIHKRDLPAAGEERLRAQRRWRSPNGYYYEPPSAYIVPPDAGYYGPGYYGRPWHDYGRPWYDWWQHVPPQYWRHLP